MTSIWMTLLVAGISITAWGQSKRQDSFALTASQVAQTLTNQGTQIADEQVSLPADVVATAPNPVLEVLSVGPIGDRRPEEQSLRRSWVKLKCHEPGICLPFYAIVTLPESATGLAVNMASALADVTGTASKEKAEITMRSGAHATLVMEDNRSHIQVAVISLENGIVGHRIRVASPDHKQVYIAEVVSARLLRRSF